MFWRRSFHLGISRSSGGLDRLGNLLVCLPLFLTAWRLAGLILRDVSPVQVIAVTVSVLLLCLSRRIWGLWLLIMVLLTGKFIRIGYLAEAVFLTLALLWLCDCVLRKRRPRLSRIPAGQFLVLLLTALAALLAAGDFFMTDQAGQAVFLAETLLFYFLCVDLLDSREKVKQTAFVLLLGALLSSLYGLAQFLWGFDLQPYFQTSSHVMRRVQGLLPDPNSLGTFLASLLPLPLIYLWRCPRRVFWPVMLTALIIIVGLFLTFSFTGWLGLAVAFASACFFLPWPGRPENKKPAGGLGRLKVWLPFLIVMLILALILIDKGNFFALFLAKGSTLRSRFYIWPAAWLVFQRSPFWGVGWGMFGFHNTVEMSAAAIGNTHNNYLQILAESGLAGFLSFIWIVLSVCLGWRRVWLARLSEAEGRRTEGRPSAGPDWLGWGLGCGLLVYLVNMTTQSPLLLPATAYFFWLMVALLTALWQQGANRSAAGPAGAEADGPAVPGGKLVLVISLLLMAAGGLALIGRPADQQDLLKRFQVYQAATGLDKSGWYHPVLRLKAPKERIRSLSSGLWQAKTAEFSLDIRQPQAVPAVLTGRVFSFLDPRTLRIYLNGRPVHQELINATTRNGRRQELTVPLTLPPGRSRIRLESREAPDSPYFLAISDDPRWISFCWDSQLRVAVADRRRPVFPLERIFKRFWKIAPEKTVREGNGR